MGYISKNLMGDEEIIYSAKIHWFIYIPSLFLLVLGIGLVSAGLSGDGESNTGMNVLGGFMVFLSPFSFIGALITRSTTELGITTKRVIAKTGWIRRHTVELNHSKVESFNVDQGIIGRIFGFGTVTIQGTGGGKTPIKGIDSPLKFRNEAVEIIDKKSN
tara:strand:- start:155 stop:634 length:480 start_codon:yes stop_codon:yes gene_type:complete